jgi:cell wall-associated NlpC family hydrolase
MSSHHVSPTLDQSPKHHVITADQLITAARSLKGIPWRHQGRTSSGVDCAGFIDLATKIAGHSLETYFGKPAPTGYARTASPVLHELTARYSEKINKACPGCLVLFKFEGDSYPRHYGIATYDGYVIHANAKQCGVVEHGLRAPWSRWVHSYWKIPGVLYT